MEYAITFLEGVITFISPCLLPMLPVYIAYFAGDAGRGSADGLARTVVNACGFVVGFTILFTAMGALASTAGSFFAEHQAVLNAVCGGIVMLLGLNYLGILRIPALQRTLRMETDIAPRGFFTSLVFGMVFAVGWTPCVGAFLGSALSMAATTANASAGVALLLCYSAGLGVPFIISAVLIGQLEGAFIWVKSHYRLVDGICGALLVVVGALMATGMLGMWLRVLSA